MEEGATAGALSEQLWRRATASGAFTVFEKRAFGIADDMYCLYFLCSSFSKLRVLLDKDITHFIVYRYEAGLLFAYLAFVPFSEAGVMDSLSLQARLPYDWMPCECFKQLCFAHLYISSHLLASNISPHSVWLTVRSLI